MLEVVDNVGSHHNRSVQAAYAKAGWLLEFLPPNMTHLLQPMDLVVNGPVNGQPPRRRKAEARMQVELAQRVRGSQGQRFEHPWQRL